MGYIFEDIEAIATEIRFNIKNIKNAFGSRLLIDGLYIVFKKHINLDNYFVGKTKEIENISQKYGYWVNTWTATSQKRVYKVSFRKITEEELKLKTIKNYSKEEESK